MMQQEEYKDRQQQQQQQKKQTERQTCIVCIITPRMSTTREQTAKRKTIFPYAYWQGNWHYCYYFCTVVLWCIVLFCVMLCCFVLISHLFLILLILFFVCLLCLCSILFVCGLFVCLFVACPCLCLFAMRFHETSCVCWCRCFIVSLFLNISHLPWELEWHHHALTHSDEANKAPVGSTERKSCNH